MDAADVWRREPGWIHTQAHIVLTAREVVDLLAGRVVA
jgi:hypothetical protein